MKVNFKRVCSMMLALVMVLSMVPVLANAASLALADTTIGAATSTSGIGATDSWTVGSDGKSINGSVSGSKAFSYYLSAYSTLTITNNKSAAALLSFDFSVSGNFAVGGSVTVNGTKYTAAGSHSITDLELAAGGKMTIKLTADKCNASNGANTVSINVTNVSLKLKDAGDINTTFLPGEYGTFTVNGTAITAETVMTAPAGTEYTLTIDPGTGNKFVGWYDVVNSKYLAATSTTLTYTSDLASTIQPVVYPATTPIFLVNGNRFTDLDDAVNYATANSQTKIVLISSGVISDASYTIPSGMTLLIPRDAAYTTQGAKPTETDSYVAPTNYMTLTLGTGTVLNVSGTVEVASQHFDCQGNGNRIYGGAPSGPYGAIYMNADSNITLANDATLYAWGYVYGNGTVTAKNGSKVYEYMQIADFCGGSNLSDIEQCFPIAQYYVQNVEVPLTLEYGAQEILYSSVTAAYRTFGMPVTFLATSGAMFVPGTGTSVTKTYDPKTDRTIYDVSGDMQLQSVVIKLPTGAGLAGLPSSLDSSEYILGLNGNMTINVHSGTTTIGQDVSLMPGAEIIVDQGAGLHLASGDSSALTVSGNAGGHNVYLYDLDQWGTYIFASKKLTAAAYSPTAGRYKRTAADLKDVLVDINGTVTTDGFLYTTAGGASVISSKGTGKIIMNNGAGTETAMLQLDGTGTAKIQVPVTSAQLKNADGSYTQTAGAAPGAVFVYNNGKWEAVGDYTISFNANGGTGSMADQVISASDVLAGNTAVTLNANAFTREGYTFLGWSEDASATTATYAPGASVTLSGNMTLYAVWQVNSYALTISGVDGILGGDVVYGTNLSTIVPANPTKAGFTFTGWTVTTADGTVIDAPATMPAYAVTFTANWEVNVVYYTLTFLNENGEVISTTQLEAGATIAAPAYAPEGFNLIGWRNNASGAIETVPAVMPEGNLEFQAVVEAITYTITFVSDGVEIGEVTVNYGQKATLIDAITKEGFVFQGWQSGETVYEAGAIIDVTGDMTMTAVWHGHAYTGVETTAPTCENAGVMTYTCSCGASYTEEIPALGHKHEAVVTAPTCEEKGYTTYTCHCGDSYVADYVDALGHSYDNGVVTTEPTCTDAGVKTFTCGTCGDTYTEEIAALGHKHEAVVTAPTCEDKGYTTYTCACGDSYVADYVDALGHSYDNGVVTTEPTCTDAGVKTFTCGTCGDTYTEEIAALGHKHEAVVTEPTCEDKGYTTYTCACGDSYVADYVDALGHSYDNGVVTTAPTCTDAGEMTYTCGTCGDTYTEEIAALGHKHEAVVTAPTCEDKGYTTYTCHCGDSYVADYVDALGHSYDNGVVTTEPTCTDAGVKTFTCGTCGDTYTEEIAALGHKHEAVVTAPTCEDKGYTTYTCACGDSYVADYVDALGHSYDNGVVTTEPTCTDAGVKTYTCGTCGDTYTEEIAALGHKHEAVVTAPTCEEKGYTTYTCACGDSYVADYVDALGHSYANGVCTTCGGKDPNYVPVVIPTITLKTPTLLLEDTIKLNIYYSIDQDIPLEKMGMITWKEKPSVVDISTADAVYPGATFNTDNGFFGVNTDGIPAQDLGDIIYFCIYAELADGSIAYGKQVQYSPTTYAYNQLRGGATPEMKALLVAILNYGAAAQVYLEDTDALVTSDMTDAMKALIEEYRADMVHSVAMPSAAKQGAMASNGGFGAKKPTIALEGAFSINYYFTPNKAVAGDMTFYYWNAADFEAAEVLTAENATGSYTMTEENGTYGAAIQGIAAKDIDSALYACGVYTDANGNTYSTGVLPYSLGFYCGNQAKGEGALADLASAIAVYGYYAGIYFSK